MDNQIPKQQIKNLVTIKGSNDGLSFILNEQESFLSVTEDLKNKIRRELSTLLTGPMVRVKIECGSRELTDKERQLLEEIIALKDNLILTRINSGAIEEIEDNMESSSAYAEANTTASSMVHIIDEDTAFIHHGTVRSGNELEHDGNLVIVGDVNSGAKVMATGDIYVFGKIKGCVHAGCKGDRRRVVTGASWGDAQVRIADFVAKAQSTNTKDQPNYLSTAYLDEYRILFKHK